MKRLIQITIALITCSFTINSNAQCSPVGEGTSAGVQCLFPDTEHNCLYAGGAFQNCGSETMNHCTYWNGTDFMPMTMNGSIGCNDSIWCYTYHDGSMYVGGDFTVAGGVACNHIARWDGESWFPVGDGFNDAVHSLCDHNNVLYAGGAFTMCGTNTANHLCSWDGTQWLQVHDGMNGDVESMCTWNGSLCIGGNFSMAGATTVNHICSWNGSTMNPMGNGLSTEEMGSTMVHSLCVYNNNLCAGGIFDHAGNMGMHNLAMWNGSSWNSMGDIEGEMENSLSAMCVYNNQLYIGGTFNSCGSSSAQNLACWNGSSWLNIGSGMNGHISSLAVYNNELYMGGEFSSAAGTSASNLAKYSTSTGIQKLSDPSFSFGFYPNPAQDQVTLQWNNVESAPFTIQIIDVSGRVIAQQNAGTLHPGNYQQTLQTSDIQAGSYFIHVISGEKVHTSKFTVVR